MRRWRRTAWVTVILVSLGLALGRSAGTGQLAGGGPSSLRLPPGFRAEVIYRVPREQGSWVCLATDPKGRLIASAEAGGLYRITLPAAGRPVQVEPLDLDLGHAQGLLCAFDSLYVVVNKFEGSGVYRVRDTNGDDKYDRVELLRRLDGDGEHGPHALVLGPDRASIYLVAGNTTRLPSPERSLVPRRWAEDALLPAVGKVDGLHTPDGPGGWVCRFDPEGRSFELVAVGFRNPYDAAFNPAGELLTYDSDMEWDMGTAWYRPTRVNHVASGAEFGWRTGSNKWPDHYPDGLGAVADIGPGSPTGVAFGTGAKFPARYQQALFMGDWSYGQIYAVHLRPDGATYAGAAEPFIAGTPMPITDLLIHPDDGAMYFTVGGRGTSSVLYRVTYHGPDSTAPAPAEPDAGAAARAERRRLEGFHGRTDPRAVEVAWPYLAHADRALRYAAQVAVEHQPVAEWQERALAEENPRALTAALIALARCADRATQPRLVAALGRLDWDTLADPDRLDLLRGYALAVTRLGEPDEATRGRALAHLDHRFPARSWPVDRELFSLLVALKAPAVVERGMAMLVQAPAQEEQLHYAAGLRLTPDGWSPALRRDYFRWFGRAQAARGGTSYDDHLDQIWNDAMKHLSAEERAQAEAFRERPPAEPYAELKARPFVKEWAVADLLPAVEAGLTGRDFERGRRTFAAAACAKCHRFRGAGGVTGPDLTGVGSRFDGRAILESILEPSKVIPDQYAGVRIADTSGRVHTGRLTDLNGDELTVMPDLSHPSKLLRIKRDEIEEMAPLPVSLMPAGLVNNFTLDEILDLTAYLRSRGDPKDRAFRRE